MKDVYGKLKAPGCLDVVAVHKDPDWWNHKKPVLEAFGNARNMDLVKILL